jgi:hypothetical protein
MGCKIVADDFEDVFNFFDGYPGVKREDCRFFAFGNRSGFDRLNSFTAKFAAELVGREVEDYDRKAPIAFLQYSGCHIFSRFPRFSSNGCCRADNTTRKLLHWRLGMIEFAAVGMFTGDTRR